MAEGGIGNQAPATLFQARLDTSGGVSNTLTLGQYAGNKVVVSGVTVPIPLAGLSVNIASNLIDAAGADSGAPGAANTLYYVYVSNSRATFSPESIRLSAMPPTLVNGVKYLGISGNALNWRFVGWVKLNATPQFESTLQNRLTANYYNRLRLTMFLVPGYLNGSGDLFYSINPAGFIELNVNGGSDSRLKFISNGEDGVEFKSSVVTGNYTAENFNAGIGIDSTTNPSTVDVIGFGGGVGLIRGGIVSFYDSIPPEGDHFVTPLGSTQAGGGIFVFIQFNKATYGTTNDLGATQIAGSIFG